jgi:hypothetical protein
MQRIKNVRLATQGMMAVLLFGMVFAAVGAEQTMRALPRTAPAPAANAVLAPALVPEIIIDGGGIQIGGKLVPFNNATPVSVSSSSCSLPFQFPLKNIGGKGLSFTISMKMKSEQNQSSVLDMNLGGLSLAPGASYTETHNGSGLNLVSGTTYRFTVDTDSEHNMRKDISRGHIYSVRFTASCGSTPAPTPGGTPGTTPTPTQRPPGQSMGGGLRMGSALTPRAQSSEPPPSHPKGGGRKLANTDASCFSDNTPRISNINGKTSATLSQSGFLLQPGSQLNIVGCGFGPGGQAYLNAGDRTVPLKINSWKDSNVVAKIDDALGGVPDFGMLTVYVKPNSVPAITLAGPTSFRAARETAQWALPLELGKYSNVYGAPKVSLSPDGKSTIVERNARYTPFCPAQKDQTDMVDFWPTASDHLKQGFEVVGVDFQNMTSQESHDYPSEQTVLVGDIARAQHEKSKNRIAVTFQGHSWYLKSKFGDGGGAYSICTSRYSVSARITGPRGVAPFK